MNRNSYYFGFHIFSNLNNKSRSVWSSYNLLLNNYNLLLNSYNLSSSVSLNFIPDMINLLTSDLTINFNETFYLYFGLPLYYERLFNSLFESSFIYFVSDFCRFQRLKRSLVWYNFINDNYLVELNSLELFYYNDLDFDDVEDDIYVYLQTFFVFWGPLEMFYSNIASFSSLYFSYNLFLVLAYYFHLYRLVNNKVWSPLNLFDNFLFSFVFVNNNEKFANLWDCYFNYNRDLTFYIRFRFWLLLNMFPLVLFNLCIDIIVTWLCMRVDALLNFFYSLSAVL